MKAPLRLVFLGSDPIALPFLQWMTNAGRGVAQVTAVFTPPDRAMGRGQNVQSNAIKEWALERGLPVVQPEKITEDVRLRLAALGADVALVMAYGHILRDDFIGTPRLGTLNLHTSLLPKYRGASPIQTAMASGEHETGVTLMRIVRKLDAGPLADLECVPIAPLDTALEVEAKLAVACVPLLARALPRLAAGELIFTPQDEAAATYCRKLGKEDGALDFAEPSAVLASRINGLFPWPACTITLNGQVVKIGLAEARPAAEGLLSAHPERTPGPAGDRASPEVPGTVIALEEQGLLVTTGEGLLRLRRLQRPGGRMIGAAEFLRGFPVAPGTRLASRPMPELRVLR